MELKVFQAEEKHSEFVFKCLQHLLNKQLYTYEQFMHYYKNVLSSADKPHLWIAQYGGELVGFISATKFYMNRYLGYGFELEEIVICKEFQGEGLGTAFINFLIDFYGKDRNCRKMIVKSNDHLGSCILYKKLLGETNFKVYAKRLNDVKL